MDPQTLKELRGHFQAVADTIAEAVCADHPRAVALVAKWDKDDLVPGLSDLDFRIICDAQVTAEDWVAIDRATGRVHRDMVGAHPEWNRINEHTAGAGMTLPEVFDRRLHNPEYPLWSLWWGEVDWLDRLKREMADRPFGASDEHVHLSKFVTYYSPYLHDIDPPINLGPFEAKYALHSRCWHYFAPPMTAAACLLARRNFPGKRAALGWLIEQGHIAEQVNAVLAQVDAHYETPELNDADRLAKFEAFLFEGFEKLYPALLDAVEELDVDTASDPKSLKGQLAQITPAPLEVLVECLRFARIRAGRYDFYTHAPAHFDAGRLLLNEIPWVKKLTGPIYQSIRALIGQPELSPRACFEALGIRIGGLENIALMHVLDLAQRDQTDAEVPRLFRDAVNIFPTYYRMLESALNQLLTPAETTTDVNTSATTPAS